MSYQEMSPGVYFNTYVVGMSAEDVPRFELELAVKTAEQWVGGIGWLRLADDVGIQTFLQGTFLRTTMDDITFTSVLLTGLPQPWPQSDGPSAALNPNAQVHVLLTDWDDGWGSFRYLDPNGQWQNVGTVLVRPMD